MSLTLSLPRSVLSVMVSTAAQVAPFNATRQGLFIFNASAATGIWICPGDNVPGANSPGSLLLTPLEGITLGSDFPFTAAVMAFAAAPSALTIWEF